VVAGLPRSLDGSTGQQAVKVQKIIDHLSSKLGISIACQDERYSTNRAREILVKNKGRAKSTRTRDDAVAAALILEDYLKAHNPPGSDGNEFAAND
jgi:putative Holliday junction resolvase